MFRGKAYWLTIWEPCGNSIHADKAKCSKCGMISTMPVGDYCKWCGRKMIGSKYFEENMYNMPHL